MILLYLIIIFQILFEYIKSGISKECEIGNYCSTGACSTFGNCKIDVFNITNISHFESKCECNTAYSSYDIDVLELKDSTIYCCYEQKSQFNAFLIETFLGFGFGHFYFGDIKFGLVKFFLQISLCFICTSLTYVACTKEHTIIINLDDINKKEEYKLNENIDNEEMKELNENIDNDKISENENYDEEENKYNDIVTKDLIKCPIYKFFIFLSIILFIVFQIGDIICMGLGYYKDENGENLVLWY